MAWPDQTDLLYSSACNREARADAYWRLIIRVLLVAALALIAVLPSTGFAYLREASVSQSQAEDFSQARFEQAQQEGRIILVETYADWCAPCRIQAPIVERLRRTKPYRNLVLLRVNENTPRHVWKDLGLAGYGQFIVFRGARETGRGSPLNEAEMRKLLSG